MNTPSPLREIEIGLLFLAPPFRFALVGIEVYAFSQFKELKDDLAKWYSSGVVLAEAVWQG
jgi:hypothetical protein